MVIGLALVGLNQTSTLNLAVAGSAQSTDLTACIGNKAMLHVSLLNLLFSLIQQKSDLLDQCSWQIALPERPLHTGLVLPEWLCSVA